MTAGDGASRDLDQATRAVQETAAILLALTRIIAAVPLSIEQSTASGHPHRVNR